MTIQIDELVIRTTVVESGQAPAGGAAGGDNGAGQREQMLQECVERVLDILRQREER